MRTNSNNNTIIDNNNNCGRLQDLILIFKIPMGTRKNFFEIYTQFKNAPSKRFCQPSLSVSCNTIWLRKDRQMKVDI